MIARGKKVAIMMSGGVDSSVAAALLLQQGYPVVGITLKLVPQQATHGYGGCCAYSDAVDARRVAQLLGIDHYMLNISEDFSERVIEPFESAYRQGQTPNPCIECNRRIKFDLILQKARQLGLETVATGHYARIQGEASGYHLKRGVDPEKDQSYFLYVIDPAQLPHIVFPVGHLTKTESRQIAESLRLPVARKADSQDICFVQGGNYRNRLALSASVGGLIKNRAGEVLGEHSGIEHFTIGQRKGIRLPGGPFYVLALDARTQTVVVGSRDEAFQRGLEASQAVYLEPVRPGQRVWAKIRSRHEPAPAVLEQVTERQFRLRFDEPQWAVTPGQSAVLYDGDLVLGGGIIESAL